MLEEFRRQEAGEEMDEEMDGEVEVDEETNEANEATNEVMNEVCEDEFTKSKQVNDQKCGASTFNDESDDVEDAVFYVNSILQKL